MNLEQVRNRARETLQGVCRVCRICDGRACAGEMPGMGGRGTGGSFQNNVAALKNLRLNLRTMHSVSEPDLTCELFRLKSGIPVFSAPMCGTRGNFRGLVEESDFINAQVMGAREAGTAAFIGDSPDPALFQLGLEAVAAAGGRGVAIIKPREPEEIIERIVMAKKAGAPAAGIDIDAAAFDNFAKAGVKTGPLNIDQLAEIIKSAVLPVLLKGIMTVDEAEMAAEAGAAGIVVSNHGGRALDDTPGTAAVLPRIAAAVKGRLTVLVDGGIRSGEDVLKMLALGAEAVLIGRPIAIAAVGGGALGVKRYLETIAAELKAAMILTGCPGAAAAGQHLLDMEALS